MKKYLCFLVTILLLLAVSCADNIDRVLPVSGSDKDEGRVMQLTASVIDPTNTRADLIETTVEGVKVLRYQWEVGDEIELAFVEGTTKVFTSTLVTSLSNENRTAHFSVEIPTGITGDFTLYAYRGAGTLDTSDPVKVVLPSNLATVSADLSNQAELLSVWSKQEVEYNNIDTPAISLDFEHLGAVFTVHIQNSGGQDIDNLHAVKLVGNMNWLRNEGDTPAVFDMAIEEYEDEGAGASLTIGAGSIPARKSATFYRWFIPGDYIAGNLLSVSSEDASGTEIGTSGGNGVNAADFQVGVNYGMYLTINTDEENEMTFSRRFTESMEITTTKAIGSTITLKINAASTNRPNVWVDLNNNGSREEGEEVTTWNANVNYTIKSQIITVYGRVTEFDCRNQELIKLEVWRNDALEKLWVPQNSLTGLDLTQNERLNYLSIWSNPSITGLDISQNSLLTFLGVQRNAITTEAFNQIFNDLPDVSSGTIDMWNNAGNGNLNADISIATAKGWTVNYTNR